MPTATLTSKGQLTLPRKIREHFKLTIGDKINFQILPNSKVLIEPETIAPAQLFGVLKARRHISVTDMDKAIRKRAAKK